MSVTMADDQHFLRTENRTVDNMISEFPDNFKIYVEKNQLLWERGIFNRGWIFSSREDDRCGGPPPASFSEIIDLDFETPIAANRELIEKIKSIVRWMVFLPGQFLVQFWKSIEIGGRRFLRCRDQPFGLTTTHRGLCSCRLKSLDFQFYVDVESDEELGLPGRVFRRQLPESTLNEQYYPCKEYPQHDHAVVSNIRRSWALPVLEPSGRCCVGVLELVIAAEPRYPFTNLIDGIYRRFEEVGLRSSETPTIAKDDKLEVIGFSKDDKLDSFQIPTIARSPDRMENGREMMCLDLSDQQLLEVDARDTGNNVVSNTEKNSIVVTSTLEQCITNSSQRQHRKAGIPITLEDNQKSFGVKLDDAAESLRVSPSTLKRACMEYNISCWSRHKRNKDNNSLSNKFVQGAAQDQIRESSHPPISDPPRKQDLAATTCTKVHSMTTQDTSIVTIKAKYEDNFIKFKLPVLSGMIEFQQEVKKRLNLQDGTYIVKYQDDGNNWISIAGDGELQDCIHNSKSLGKNTVTMSIEPITNCPISDPPREQDLAATTCTKVHSMATQDTSIVTIKAKYEDNFIKFKLPVLSGMVEFQQEVKKRVNLQDGTYSVKYQDDGNNWISIAGDGELQDCIRNSKSLGMNTVTISIEPITNCPISDPPREQDLAATTCTKVHSMTTQDTSIVTIKAKYEDNFIKFKLPVLSGMIEFQQEVKKRLNLQDGTYIVKYQDDGNNWISIAGDGELQDCIRNSKSLGKNTVTMSIEPITNCPISDPPREQDLAATTCTKVHSMATQDTSIVTIKAKYEDNFIKFKLPVLSGMVEFQQEVKKRVNLQDGTYSVKYQDDGNNWISIAGDGELQDCIRNSKSLGMNTVTISIEPITNCPISDPPREQDLAATTCTKVHSMTTQDTSIVTIKAKYEDNFIKFKLPVLSGMVEFQQEVKKRLNLQDGTYSVKYQDEGNNWISIAGNGELQDCIHNSKSLGKNTVTMSLQPITICPP